MFIVFVTTLAAGLLGVLAMCRMTQVAWKFVRLIAIFALCLLVPVLAGFFLWGGWQRGTWPVWAAALTGSAAMAAFVVLGLAPTARRYGGIVRAFATIGGLLAVPAAWAWGHAYGIWPRDGAFGGRMILAGQIISAALIGSVCLATALGHAYLTHTAMTIHPLRRLARIFAAALAARFAWVILGIGMAAWRDAPGDTPVLATLQAEWLMLVVRVGVGLALPSVFAYMILQTVRLRATQSATGILYFTLVLVFIGELAGLNLIRATGLPF